MTRTPSQRIPWKRLAGEFIVIFAGVTMSLAADDWNSRRQDRLAEQAVLMELSADLGADSADMSQVLRQMERHDRAALWLLQQWENSSANMDSISARFRTLAFFSMYQPVSATYAGLRDAGRLTLIRDAELRREIVRFYEMRQPYILQFTDPYATAAYEPLQAATAPYWRRRIDASATSLRGGSFTLEPLQSWPEMTDDHLLRYQLHSTGSYAATAALRMRAVIADNSELRVRLAEAMAR